MPSASVFLKSLGYDWAAKYIFMSSALMTIISPLFFGSLADYKFPANRIMLFCSLLTSVLVWLAFRTLAWGWNPWYFLTILLFYGFLIAPVWALSSVVALSNLSNPDHKFAWLRLGATIGWPLAGYISGSVLKIDHSPDLGNLAAVFSVGIALSCLMLPHTPPMGDLTKRKSWKQTLGLEALSLFKERDQRVFFITAALSSIPMAAIYMHGPVLLEELGDQGPSSTMALGQVSEMVAMIFIGGLLTKMRAKTVLALSMVAGLIRFAMFSMAGYYDSRLIMILGIPMHGIVYTFWYITGQLFIERRVETTMRAQAQSLLNVVYVGIGGFVGTLLVDYWHKIAVKTKGSWELYWFGLFIPLLLTLFYFLLTYRSKKNGVH